MDLGFFRPLLCWESPEGLMLVDGEARRELLEAEVHADWLVPCVVTDLTEDEAKLALTVCDPLSALAEVNANALEALLRDVGGSEDQALDALLSKLAVDHGIDPPDFDPVPFGQQGSLDERKQHECPECGHKFK